MTAVGVWAEAGESPVSWAYMLKLVEDKWYLGYARDPESRIQQHHDGLIRPRNHPDDR